MVAEGFETRLREAFNGADNKKIAVKMGVSPSAVSNYFNGRIPDAEKLLQIAELTNCNLHWLLTGKGKRLGLESESIFGENDLPTIERLRAEEIKRSGKEISLNEFLKMLGVYAVLHGLERGRSERITNTVRGNDFRSQPETALGEIIREIIRDEMFDGIGKTIIQEMIDNSQERPQQQRKATNARESRVLTFDQAGRAADTVQNLGTVDEFDIAAAVEKHNDPYLVMDEWFRFEKRDLPGDYGAIFFEGWETFTRGQKIDAVKDAKKVLDRTLKKK